MQDQNDHQLLQEIARRNWFIFALLLLLSALWRSPSLTIGIAAGGLVAIAGYHWLHRSLRTLLFGQEPGAARRFQFGYVVRLGALAMVLVLLLRAGIHPVGLAAGLSVVILNIFWTTFKRAI